MLAARPNQPIIFRHPGASRAMQPPLAALMMWAGDPREAVTVGRQAISDAGPLRSKRIVAELEGMARAAEPTPTYCSGWTAHR